MKPRLAGLPATYRKRIDPALALTLAVIALAAILAGTLYAVREGGTAPRPTRVETSQSACPTRTPNPPPGYKPCDPIPTNTGFQTGDTG